MNGTSQYLILGMVATVALALLAIVAVVIFRDSDSTLVVSSIIGFASVLELQLYGLLKVRQVEMASKVNAEKIEEVHVATNSMKDQLLAATAAASHAEGVADAKLESIVEAEAAAVRATKAAQDALATVAKLKAAATVVTAKLEAAAKLPPP